MLVTASRKNRRLVEQVGQIGTREARGELSDAGKIDIISQRLVSGMDVQDLFAALHIRGIDNDLTIEAARAKQGRVKNVGTVGCGNENNGIVGLEAVHFNEQLIQGLLAFIVATA